MGTTKHGILLGQNLDAHDKRSELNSVKMLPLKLTQKLKYKSTQIEPEFLKNEKTAANSLPEPSFMKLFSQVISSFIFECRKYVDKEAHCMRI